jgi:ribulose-5-phosphate 4-epimerase/fuculose-1-phosphate aldolase
MANDPHSRRDPHLRHARESPSQLAEAIRILTRAGAIDHSGHGSVRRDAWSFQINSGASVRATLTAADIVTIDLAGQHIAGSARPPLEFPIHAEIYRARPDAGAIMHTHPRWSTLLTIAGVPYRPVFGQGALLGEVPVFDSPLSVHTEARGRELAAALGAGRAVLLKSHGAVIVGADLLECFALTVYLEENAQRQYMAMQIGEPYVLSQAEQAACRQRLWSASLFQKAWEHYREMNGPGSGAMIAPGSE